MDEAVGNLVLTDESLVTPTILSPLNGSVYSADAPDSPLAVPLDD